MFKINFWEGHSFGKYSLRGCTMSYFNSCFCIGLSWVSCRSINSMHEKKRKKCISFEIILKLTSWYTNHWVLLDFYRHFTKNDDHTTSKKFSTRSLKLRNVWKNLKVHSTWVINNIWKFRKAKISTYNSTVVWTKSKLWCWNI